VIEAVDTGDLSKLKWDEIEEKKHSCSDDSFNTDSEFMDSDDFQSAKENSSDDAHNNSHDSEMCDECPPDLHDLKTIPLMRRVSTQKQDIIDELKSPVMNLKRSQ